MCLSFLSDHKIARGIHSSKWKNLRVLKEKEAHNRRNSRCGHDESPTENTLFHKVKLGITDTFEMCYDIITSKKGENSIWPTERYGIKQMIAWLLRRKVAREILW